MDSSFLNLVGNDILAERYIIWFADPFVQFKNSPNKGSSNTSGNVAIVGSIFPYKKASHVSRSVLEVSVELVCRQKLF